MKCSIIKSSLAFFLILAITAAGCLKDKAYDNGEIQSVRSMGDSKIIEIKLTAADTRNFHSYSYNNSSNDTVVDLIPVNLASADVAPVDLHVTLVANDALVTAYNADNTDTTITATNPNPTGVITNYIIPTKYTVVNPGGVVTIPKGSHTGYLQIKFKPSDFLGISYAVGFTISKITEGGYTISGNNQNGIAVINIKNQYDGNYHVFGRRVHPVLGNFDFDYNENLNTTSANSVVGNVLADLTGEGLNITINADNSITLSGDQRTVFLQAGKVNKYDPATKTFTLNYFYNTGAPRLINETLVKN